MEPENSCDQKGSLSRRDFALRIATIAAAAVATSAALVAEPPQKPAAPAKPAAAPAQGPPPLSEADQAEVNANYDAIMARYGTRLSEAQKKQVRQQLEFAERGLGPLRAFPLVNGDEPATMFGPLASGAGQESER